MDILLVMHHRLFPLLAWSYGMSALAAVLVRHADGGAWTVLLTFWLGGAALVFTLPMLRPALRRAVGAERPRPVLPIH